jgi:hypothetical protein
MRRLAVTALILIAAAVVATTAFGVPVVARSKAVVRIKSCSLEDHSAVFYARMRKLHGTRRMRMRFALLERAAGESRFKRVRVPGLSRWHKSAEGVKAYGYSQEVRGLHDGSVYRMRVRYRWYDSDNQLQRSTRRTSRKCRMFVPQPNLRVHAVQLRAGSPLWRYSALVKNAGQAEATNVAVQLRVDGDVVDTETIASLAPGESSLRTLEGPRCTNRYTFRVDPADAIAETDEGDNRAIAAC